MLSTNDFFLKLHNDFIKPIDICYTSNIWQYLVHFHILRCLQFKADVRIFLTLYIENFIINHIIIHLIISTEHNNSQYNHTASIHRSS